MISDTKQQPMHQALGIKRGVSNLEDLFLSKNLEYQVSCIEFSDQYQNDSTLLHCFCHS